MSKIIKQIIIKNMGKFREFSISLDRNTTYIIGPNGSGKTWTGLHALQIALQGVAEKAMLGKNPLIADRFRVIGPTAPSGQVCVVFYDEKEKHEIRITRHVTKSGTDLKIEAPEGVVLTQDDLNDLFNAFMINPQAFINLSGQNQARALGIDTATYDKRLIAEKAKYTEINAVIRSMGTLIEPEKAEQVDFVELSKQKDEILDFNRQQDERQQKIDQATQQVEELSQAQQEKLDRITELENEIKTLKADASKLAERVKKGNEFIKTLPVAEEKKLTDAVDKEIKEANETNRKATAYQQWKEKDLKLKDTRASLEANKKAQETIEAERLEYIKSFKFPFKNLRVDEEGNLLLDDKLIKDAYFSTGELMKIVPTLIATTKPQLKYVFIKDSNLMDDERLDEVVDYLTAKGFQLLIEVRGKKLIEGKNCILLKDQQVITAGGEDEVDTLEV